MSFEAIIYFDGATSRWLKSPASNETLARRTFRLRFFAEAWAMSKVRGLTNVKYEVRQV